MLLISLRTKIFFLYWENVRYRELVFQLFRVESSWVQPILMLAKPARIISTKEYGDAIVGLAAEDMDICPWIVRRY